MNRRDEIILLAVAAACVVAVLAVGRKPGVARGFPLDDAWIQMVYGRGIASEGRLAYNPGHSATGCTAPLWALCVAVPHLVAGEDTSAVVGGVMLIGALLFLWTVWLAADLVTRLSGQRLAGWVAGLAVATSAPLAVGAVSGMEVMLCAAVCLAAVRAAVTLHFARAGWWLALAAAARPEAAAVSAACFVFLAGRVARRHERMGAAALVQLVLPSLFVGVAILIHHQLASGRPLPSTFYFKQDFDPLALPGRLATTVTAILDRVPPLRWHLGWLALLGFVTPGVRARDMLPLVAGVSFVLAVAVASAPIDPAAFYHVRYDLPAVPLLAAGLVLAASHGGAHLERLWRQLPVALVLAVALLGSAATLVPAARHYHNDVRNINEVQVAMGCWLDTHLPADARIAATDAGAVRYFGRRPVVDVMGLNTPDLYWDRERFVLANPVDAAAFMLAWQRPVDRRALLIYQQFTTADYTVTSFPAMAQQVVLGRQGTTSRVAFEGIHSFDLIVRANRIQPP